MQPTAPFHPAGEHFGIDLPGARALFTTRRGGHSGGPYASLNLGRLTDDDPVSVELNRRRLESEIGRPLAFVHQVHGARVRVVPALAADRGRGAGGPAARPLERADGQVTAAGEIALAALTADCLPVAVAGAGAVAMLHAGWRGLRDGMLGEGVRALRELGGPGALAAAIGPGAGPCCYEVGADVHAAFAELPPAVHRGSKLDLKAIAAHQLRACGVAEIHDLGLCTICSDPALLYSHRRDRGVTGRQAGLAWLS